MNRSPHRPIDPTCHSDTLAVAMVSGAANQPNRRRANRGDSNNGHQSETNSRGHYVRRPAVETLQMMMSGSRRESHPPAPTDPGVTISRHRALVILSTRNRAPMPSGRRAGDAGG